MKAASLEPFSGHVCPFPYAPCIAASMEASSLAFAESLGAGMTCEVRRRRSFRAMSSGSCSPAKRCDSWTFFVTYSAVACSVRAARASVSSVM